MRTEIGLLQHDNRVAYKSNAAERHRWKQEMQEMKTRLESVNCAFKQILFENDDLKRFNAWMKAQFVQLQFENESLVQENRQLNAELAVERSRNKPVDDTQIDPDHVEGDKERVVVGDREYSAALLALSRLTQGEDQLFEQIWFELFSVSSNVMHVFLSFVFVLKLGGPLSYSGLTDIDWRTNEDNADTSNTSIDTGIDSPSHDTCNDSSSDAAATVSQPEPEPHNQKTNHESIASAAPEIEPSIIVDDTEEMLTDLNIPLDIESLYKFVETMTAEAPKINASPADDSLTVAMETIAASQEKNISVIVEDDRKALQNEIDQQLELNTKQHDDDVCCFVKNSQAESMPDVPTAIDVEVSITTVTTSRMETRRISRSKMGNVPEEVVKEEPIAQIASPQTEIKSLICEYPGCDRSFSRKNHLNQHSRSHTAMKGSYACEHRGCDKSFNLKAHHKRHKRQHADENPYICDYESCGKAFRSKAKLNLHKRVHGEGKA